MMATKNQTLQFTQVVTLDFVCSGQMYRYAEHNEHSALYLASFDLGQKAQQFLFPVLELAAGGV